MQAANAGSDARRGKRLDDVVEGIPVLTRLSGTAVQFRLQPQKM